MPRYDKTELGAQADELGFIRDTFEKVLRLTGILVFINADSLLSEALALKGGTAINLTVFNLSRLSVDIDLDYTRNNALAEMTAEREKINQVITQHMNGHGYIASSKTRGHHSLDGLMWSYTNAAGAADSIKVEINYSMRAHVLPTERRPLLALGEGTVVTLSPIEIYASKIVALLTRAAPRDVYDIDHLVQADLFAESDQRDLFRRCVGTDKVPDLTDYSRILELTPRRIRTQLQPVLRKRDWFDLPAAQQRVTAYLSKLLQLEPAEQEFLDAFRGGRWEPELLFSGDCLERVRSHPMAAWKLNPR